MKGDIKFFVKGGGLGAEGGKEMKTKSCTP